jgi:hypothetical protein
MDRKIIMIASIILLIATPGAADAGTTSRPQRSRVPASAQAAQRLDSFDWALSTSAANPNARRYFGGPKSSN